MIGDSREPAVGVDPPMLSKVRGNDLWVKPPVGQDDDNDDDAVTDCSGAATAHQHKALQFSPNSMTSNAEITRKVKANKKAVMRKKLSLFRHICRMNE